MKAILAQLMRGWLKSLRSVTAQLRDIMETDLTLRQIISTL